MPKIAVDDDVLEGLVKAARLVGQLAVQGVVPPSSDVAAAASASLEKLGSVFLDDGRFGPDVERALLWVGRRHIEDTVEDVSEDQVHTLLNADWGGLSDQAYAARDMLVESLAELTAPSAPAA